MLQRLDSVIIIGAGVSQLPIIQIAKNKGYKIIAIDQNPEAPGFKYVDVSLIISTYKTEKVMKKLENLFKEYNYVSIICRTSGKALYTAAAVAEKFSLNGLSKEIVPLATEKSQLRMFCDNNDLPMPRGVRVNATQNKKLEFQFPVIVKPDLPVFGKKDIAVIWNDNDIPNAISAACESSGNGYAEIEEYIEGIDVSALFHLNNGQSEMITYWDELVALDNDNAIIGLGVSVPSVIDGAAIKGQIEKIISRFSSHFINIEALMILSFRIGMGGIINIIELHADLGGDLIADQLFPKANSTFDFFEMAVQLSLGENKMDASPDFKPTALIYNKSKYETPDHQNYEISGDHFFFKNKSQIDNHTNLFKLFKSCNNIRSIPQHYQWLIQYREK